MEEKEGEKGNRRKGLRMAEERKGRDRRARERIVLYERVESDIDWN